MTCQHCGITSEDGSRHAFHCPVLVFFDGDPDDDDREPQSDGMTPPDGLHDPLPIPNDGASGDLFEAEIDAFVAGPPDIIPTDAMLDAEFRALDDTRPDPNQDGA